MSIFSLSLSALVGLGFPPKLNDEAQRSPMKPIEQVIAAFQERRPWLPRLVASLMISDTAQHIFNTAR
jgi:hypothetical protein